MHQTLALFSSSWPLSFIISNYVRLPRSGHSLAYSASFIISLQGFLALFTVTGISCSIDYSLWRCNSHSPLPVAGCRFVHSVVCLHPCDFLHPSAPASREERDRELRKHQVRKRIAEEELKYGEERSGGKALTEERKRQLVSEYDFPTTVVAAVKDEGVITKLYIGEDRPLPLSPPSISPSHNFTIFSLPILLPPLLFFSCCCSPARVCFSFTLGC